MPTISKTATKKDIERAKSLLARIHKLQSDLYYFEDYLKEKNLAAYESVGEAGFELDTSHVKMQDALDQLTISSI